MDMPKSMDQADWGLLILLSVLWGGAFFFIGVAVKELPPLTIVMARVVMAAVVLLPLFWFKGFSLPRRVSDWKPFFVMSILNNAIPFSLLVAGQQYLESGLAAVINAMTPLFAVLVMAAFSEERLTGPRAIGIGLGVAGVAILRGIEPTGGWEQTLGILLCLGAALSYAFAALWGRRNLGGDPPLKSATLQLLSSSLVMTIIAGGVERPWTLPAPSIETVAALVGLAVLATSLAYLVFYKILVRAGAANAMLVTLLIPVSAMFLGAAFLDESFQIREIVGALVIGLGLIFIDGRIFRRFQSG